ncbi:MAG: DNA repair protein RecO [Bacilli bacterium]
MEIKSVEGIIISETPYGESSKILNVITRDNGIIGILAKGAKRLKSPLRSVSDKFTYAMFQIIYKEGKLSTLVSADVINPFKCIKKDIIKVSYLNFITELTQQVMRQSTDKLIYEIYVASILKIDEGFDPAVITNILELKFLDFLGVSPKLNACVGCGKESVVTLSPSKGGFVCHNCLQNDYIVGEKTIKMIKMLKYVDISKISKLEVGIKVKKEINDFIDEYYDLYTGLYLKSKNFLKSLTQI